MQRKAVLSSTFGLAVAFAVMAGAPHAEMVAPSGVVRDCPQACPEMVLIPPGEFVMGSPATEPARETPEAPVHTVRIARSFLVGKYDVTVGQYARFMAETRHNNGDTCNERPDLDWRDPGFRQGDDSPVVCVSYVDAQAYVDWLSEKTGHPYRLLSEAEYEYVNRAGSSTAYWWGPTIGENHASCVGCGSKWDNRGASPVGSFAPNPFGLYDTTGNVYAWVADCWNDSYASAPTDGSANLKGDCTHRGLRGGGWGSGASHLRSAFRLADPSGARHDNMGFRVARDR